MTRTRLLMLLAFAALPALAQDPPEAEQGEVAEVVVAPVGGGLKEELAALATDPIFTSAVAGVSVVDAESGEEIWSNNDAGMMPASVMKTFTAAIALKTLGPTYRFPTWVMTNGTVDADGVLKGNLYIKGQGDPTMVVERMWKMVHDIKIAGINEIKGDVIFDDGYFADTTLIPGWTKEEDIQDGPTYFAPLGALSLNYNIATLVIRPATSAGSPAIAQVETPTSVVVLESTVTTGRAGSRVRLKVDREVDEETGKIVTFKVEGSVPAEGDTERIYKTLADPLGNYMSGFAALSKELGIKVRGSFKGGTTPTDAELVVKEESDTLVNILAEMNKHSNNFMAEQILRGVGAEVRGLPGTTEKGLAVMGEWLGTIGVPPADIRLVNGSGLSREIQVRPSTVTRVLSTMWKDVSVGPEFLTTLAVGGRDGTLWARFRESGLAGRVRGKTGSLTGVNCLAGYVISAEGKTYAFSFLVNNIEGASSRARSVHDRLVRTLAGAQENVADAGETSP